jgi:Spy/CpxP family protein refolding chaperone
VSALAGLVAFAALALAAPPQNPGPGGPRGEGRPGEEAAKIVDAYIVSNLQESLALTDEQFTKLLPLVKRLLVERREYVQGRGRNVRELRKLLHSGTATETQVTDQLREVKRVEIEGPEKIRKTSETIDAALTPLQQAKFRVLEADVERRIREILGQVRRQGRAGPRPGSPAAPDEP